MYIMRMRWVTEDYRALGALLAAGCALGNDPIATSPGRLIRRVRRAHRVSQLQLAERSGVHRSVIARLEKGASDIQVGTLQRLLKGLGCGLVFLPASAEALELCLKEIAQEEKIREESRQFEEELAA
jgi:transcriptional regulator with XRE-family HTH domain